MKKKKLNLKYENYCLQCGKKFKTHKHNVVVCSPECAIKRKRDKDKSYWKKYAPIAIRRCKTIEII